MRQVLLAPGWKEREAYLSQIYRRVAEAHNALKITEPLETKASPFYSRPYLVIHAERFVNAICEALEAPSLKALDRAIGSVKQFLDSTDILTTTALRKKLGIVWS